MHAVFDFVMHLGPNFVGNWICFIMLVVAVLAGITQSSHLAMLQLFIVAIGVGTGWAMGF